MKQVDPYAVFTAARQFNDNVLSADPLGRGKINDTWLIACKEPLNKFVLQRINTAIFKKPEQIVDNIRTLNKWFSGSENQPLIFPELIASHNGKYLYQDQNGCSWRALKYIEGETIENDFSPAHAYSLGKTLGTFHDAVSSLPIESFHDTLPGLHDTPGHYRLLQETCRKQISSQPDVQQALDYFAEHQHQYDVLHKERLARTLRRSIIHGDPKVDNLVFNPETDEAIALIDPDTIKPGLLLHDFGDAVRSACRNPDDNQFSLELFDNFSRGYAQTARKHLAGISDNLIENAVHVLPLELGIRYLTDFLSGGTYFKKEYPLHSLDRSLAQIKLSRSINRNARPLLETIQRYFS